MTIDEVIEYEKKLAKEIYVEAMLCHANPADDKLDDCIENGKYHEQIAEWLEELKKLRQCTNIENREYPYFDGFKVGKQLGYNKAIYDFVKMAYDELLYNEHLTEIDIDYIAEKLKVGANNDKSI